MCFLSCYEVLILFTLNLFAGGVQRGMEFWKTILAAYSKPNNIILQLLPDGPMLAALGQATGRHILQACEDKGFLESIRSAQEDLVEQIVNILPPASRFPINK